MMTSYVIAHLNIRRAIEETLGSVPKTQLPTNIFLANTLVRPKSNMERHDHMRSIGFSQAIEEEAYNADTWKEWRPIKVILGNPPYPPSPEHPYDISEYRTETDGTSKLKDRNSKVLNWDYVKFFRFAQEIIERFGEGVLAFVSPHTYIDAPTFRGMRASLLRTFDKIYVVNLHGNTNKREIAPDGGIDENIFDIKQGIALFIGVKTTRNTEWATVKYTDLWGRREEKFNKLLNEDMQFTDVTPDRKMAYFMNLGDKKIKGGYKEGICVAELFPINVSGVKSGNDRVAIAPTREELQRRLEIVRNASSDNQIMELFGNLQSCQTVEKIRDDVYDSNGTVTEISFRPFDRRWIYFSGSSGGWAERPREKKTIGHLVHQIETPDGKNVGIVFTRGDTTPNDYSMVFVSDVIIDNRITAAQTAGNASIAPLHLYNETNDSWTPNFDRTNLEKLITHLSFKPTSIQVFDYIYGILHDPNYRKQFNNLLKRDYPRVPVICNPSDIDNPDAFYVSEEHFLIYVDAGEQLRKLHLLHDRAPVNLTVEPIMAKDLKIDKIKYSNGILKINKKTSIHGISEEVWNFRIGGYQALDKWFKTRKGETMTIDDFDHISNVVGLLERTLEIQGDLKKLR
jgi:predicted helicase